MFQARLNQLLHDNPGQQLTIKVGNFTWLVPLTNHQLRGPTLEQFIQNLELETLDYLFVSASHATEVTIIVFDYYCVEKIYEWF